MGSEMCIRDRPVDLGIGAVEDDEPLVRVEHGEALRHVLERRFEPGMGAGELFLACLLYTSDAADERSSVDLGGRRIIKKKNTRRPTDRDETKNRRRTIYIET